MYWVWTSVARKLGEDRNTFFFIFLAASFSYNTCTVSDNTCVDTKRLNEYLASGNKPTRIPVITGYWYIVLQPQYGNKTKKKLWYFVYFGKTGSFPYFHSNQDDSFTERKRTKIKTT